MGPLSEHGVFSSEGGGERAARKARHVWCGAIGGDSVKIRKQLPAVTAAVVVLALGTAPLIGRGADHLDAPGLTSPEGQMAADINDVYVFEGADTGKTVLVMTTHPAAGAISPTKYATDVRYVLNVDNNGDAIQDLAYAADFKGKKNKQHWTLTRYTGAEARTLAHGQEVASGQTGKVGKAKKSKGIRAFAGTRSDPFFFDLAAFRDDVLGQPQGRSFCDQPGGTGVDFFAALNTNAIVIEQADSALGTNIGVWAITINGGGQVDRMGRPAINTVFNSGNDKNVYNASRPRDDDAGFGDNVESVLAMFSGLDTEGAYKASELDTLRGVLLPDVVTYDTSTAAAGPLNGRGLDDDVIDAELNITTGGFPFPGRNTMGAIPSDCVGPHTDYMASFPYLGNAH
jgi:hypothetical protein